MKTMFTAGAVLALAGAASASVAENLLILDLTVPNQITISATEGVSAIDATATNGIGVYLENAFGADGALGAVFVSGDLSSFNEPSDGSPLLFRSTFTTPDDPGLNIWSFATTNPTFTAGVQAFSGSATWTLSEAGYNALLAGTGAGNIYANADTLDDLPANGIIGTYKVLIPTPGAAGLLGLAGLAAVRRRR